MLFKIFRKYFIQIILFTSFIWFVLHTRGMGLSTDEVCGIQFIGNSWHDFFRDTPRVEVHPPLFFMIQRIILNTLGLTVFNLRLSAVLLALVSLYFIWKTALLSGKQQAERAVIWLLLSPMFLYYAVEARMYMQLLAFSSAASYYALDWVLHRKKSHLFLYPFFLLLLLFTHVNAVFPVFFQILLILYSFSDGKSDFKRNACFFAGISIICGAYLLFCLYWPFSPLRSSPEKILDQNPWFYYSNANFYHEAKKILASPFTGNLFNFPYAAETTGMLFSLLSLMMILFFSKTSTGRKIIFIYFFSTVTGYLFYLYMFFRYGAFLLDPKRLIFFIPLFFIAAAEVTVRLKMRVVPFLITAVLIYFSGYYSMIVFDGDVFRKINEYSRKINSGKLYLSGEFNPLKMVFYCPADLKLYCNDPRVYRYFTTLTGIPVFTAEVLLNEHPENISWVRIENDEFCDVYHGENIFSDYPFQKFDSFSSFGYTLSFGKSGMTDFPFAPVDKKRIDLLSDVQSWNCYTKEITLSAFFYGHKGSYAGVKFLEKITDSRIRILDIREKQRELAGISILNSLNWNHFYPETYARNQTLFYKKPLLSFFHLVYPKIAVLLIGCLIILFTLYSGIRDLYRSGFELQKND